MEYEMDAGSLGVHLITLGSICGGLQFAASVCCSFFALYGGILIDISLVRLAEKALDVHITLEMLHNLLIFSQVLCWTILVATIVVGCVLPISKRAQRVTEGRIIAFWHGFLLLQSAPMAGQAYIAHRTFHALGYLGSQTSNQLNSSLHEFYHTSFMDELNVQSTDYNQVRKDFNDMQCRGHCCWMNVTDVKKNQELEGVPAPQLPLSCCAIHPYVTSRHNNNGKCYEVDTDDVVDLEKCRTLQPGYFHNEQCHEVLVKSLLSLRMLVVRARRTMLGVFIISIVQVILVAIGMSVSFICYVKFLMKRIKRQEPVLLVLHENEREFPLFNMDDIES